MKTWALSCHKQMSWNLTKQKWCEIRVLIMGYSYMLVIGYMYVFNSNSRYIHYDHSPCQLCGKKCQSVCTENIFSISRTKKVFSRVDKHCWHTQQLLLAAAGQISMIPEPYIFKWVYIYIYHYNQDHTWFNKLKVMSSRILFCKVHLNPKSLDHSTSMVTKSNRLNCHRIPFMKCICKCRDKATVAVHTVQGNSVDNWSKLR